MSKDDEPRPGERSYEVGYGKPPVHGRFRPGQSGNPRGRKKGVKGFRSVVSGILNEKISVTTPHGTRKVSKLEALVQSNLNNALKGDAKATDRVLKLARDVGLTDDVEEALTALTMRELSEEDRAILQRHGRRSETAEPDDQE